MQPPRAIGLSLLLPCFLLLQIIASWSKDTLYPLGAYRMFSKYWHDGITMVRVIYGTSTHRYRPWDLIPVPFFQANAGSYATFLFDTPEEQRAALCNVIRRGVPDSPLRVFVEDVQFHRTAEGIMQSKVVTSEMRYVCP